MSHFAPHTPHEVHAKRPSDTSVPSELPMAWQCLECGGTGTLTVSFPIHPRTLAGLVFEQHHAHETKTHCMCPAHYLQFWPIVPRPIEFGVTLPKCEKCGTRYAGRVCHKCN